MISTSRRPLPDNTQHSQQTNIHALGGIRTHDRSRRAAVDLRLRPRGHWDRPYYLLQELILTNEIRFLRFVVKAIWRYFGIIVCYSTVSFLRGLQFRGYSRSSSFSLDMNVHCPILKSPRSVPNLYPHVEIKCQLDAIEVFIADLIACSTCFGHHYAHHLELKSIIQWLLPVYFVLWLFK